MERQKGLALIDTIAGGTVLTVAVLGFLASVPTSQVISEGLKERERAAVTLDILCEEIHALDLEDAYALFNDDAADDPGGSGTAPGSRFAVPGLRARADDGPAGRVSFPAVVDNPSEGCWLDETADEPYLGLPRDLSGDGARKSRTPLAEIRLLPVLLTVDWAGVAGDQHLRALVMVRRR